MCAIVGVIRSRGGVDRALLDRMRDTMAHRGPDDAGSWTSADGTVGLGHRRLSIIDLSPAGHQPMTNEDGSIWLVFNGEIYNFPELRRELLRAGHQMRSNTDSEVILHAYEEWGTDAVRRLRGMFAFALWDGPRRRLLLARDRLGIKPLFYRHEGGDLTFASELKGVVADPEVPRRLDESAVWDFFTYRYVPTPKTIWRDVKKLPPGHYAVLENGSLTLTEYWAPRFGGAGAVGEAEAVEMLRGKLEECIAMHMIADVPVGVLLSGGLDSSTVCALASRSVPDRLHTFSIGFDVERHDERPFARMVAERYRTEHHEFTVTRELAHRVEDDIVALYDEPFADSSATPTFFVSELARRTVPVALSGEGGDEIFGGYSWYRLWLDLHRYDRLPQAARRLAAGLVRPMPTGTKGKWTIEAAACDPVERYALLMGGMLRRQKNELLAPAFRKRFEDYDDYWHFRRFWREDLDPLSRMQHLDIRTYLNDDILTKVDRASMAVSLEARVPLLDHELIEAVLALPVGLRNPGAAQKHLFRKAIAPWLPQAILDKKKQGFSVPLYAWFEAPTERDLAPITDNGFVSADAVRRLGVSGTDLWPLIVIGRWMARNAS